MPRGFVGRPSESYLGQVSNAHVDAANATANAVSGTSANTPPAPRARRLPFTPEDANVGGGSAGRGDSSNIIVSQSDYSTIGHRVSFVDDNVGECLYNVCAEIETMCETIFILPQAVPGCVNVSNRVKHSLGQFRSVTEDSLIIMRRYVQDIMNIG